MLKTLVSVLVKKNEIPLPESIDSPPGQASAIDLTPLEGRLLFIDPDEENDDGDETVDDEAAEAAGVIEDDEADDDDE